MSGFGYLMRRIRERGFIIERKRGKGKGYFPLYDLMKLDQESDGDTKKNLDELIMIERRCYRFVHFDTKP